MSYEYPEETIEAYPGVVLHWYCGRRIVVYQFDTILTAGLNAWADTAVTVLRDWPVDQPYLAAHDLSNTKVAMTYVMAVKYDVFHPGVIPAKQAEVDALLRTRPDFRARVALIFGISHSGYLIHTLTRHYKPTNPNIEFAGYFKRERALDWLAQKLG